MITINDAAVSEEEANKIILEAITHGDRIGVEYECMRKPESIFAPSAYTEYIRTGNVFVSIYPAEDSCQK